MKMKGIRNEKWRFLNKYLLIDQRLQLATLLFSVLVHSSQGALPLAPRRRAAAAVFDIFEIGKDFVSATHSHSPNCRAVCETGGAESASICTPILFVETEAKPVPFKYLERPQMCTSKFSNLPTALLSKYIP